MSLSQTESVAQTPEQIVRRELAVLSEKAIGAYREAADEREQLDHDAAPDQAASLLTDLELSGDAIQGYAAWAIQARPHPNPSEVLAQLRNFQPFDLLAQTSASPRLQRYILDIDHLRWMLIEYFEAQ